MNSLTVKGMHWRYRLITPTQFKKAHKEWKESDGSYPEAITITSARRIDFRTDFIDKSVIGHELFHAYVAATDTHSASLDSSQLEEVCAEIVGNNLKKMDKQVEIMYKKLKEKYAKIRAKKQKSVRDNNKRKNLEGEKKKIGRVTRYTRDKR